MDLPPPPPLFRHRNHHHHLRYENVLLPTDFIPPPYPHHLPPPPCPPPPPQTLPPHILLPPPPPLPPPPVRHISRPLPSRFTFSPPHHQIIERSYLYDLDPPPKPYFDRTLLPPSPPPPPRENVPFRIIHDYPERSPMFRDKIFHRSGFDNCMHEFPEFRDRNLQLGARERHIRVPDIDIGEHDRHRDIYYQSRELFIERDDGDRRDSGISDWGRDMFNRRDYDVRRWDNGMNDQGRVLYRETDYDERRRDNGINSRGCELYCERGNDERRWDSSRSNGLLFQLEDRQIENRQPELVDNDLSLGRFRGRLGRGPSMGNVNRPTVKSRLQKKSVLNRIQLGKDCSRRNGGLKHQHIPKKLTRGSFKGKEKGVERLQTRMEDKREREQSPMELDISFKSNALVAKAILAPSYPAVESDVKSMSLNKRSVYNVPGSSSSAKSSKTLDLNVQSDSQKTLKDLQAKAAVSGNGCVAVKDASDLGEIALKNAHLKVINLQGPSIVGCGISRSSRLRKKRRARKQRMRESDLQMEKNSDDVVDAKDCTNGQSAVSQRNADTTVSKCNLSSAFHGGSPGSLPSLEGTVSEKAVISDDSSRPSVPKLKRKRSSLTTTSASSFEAENVIMECSGHAEILLTTSGGADNVLQLGADDVACHAYEKSLANKNTYCGDSLCSNQHMNSFNDFIYDDRASVLDAVKDSSSKSVDQYTGLDSDKVDDTNEHPVLGGLMSLESSFVKGPYIVTSSIEGHDSDGSSRPQETRTPEVHEDKYFPENHELISSPNSDCAATQTPGDVSIFDIGSKEATPKDIFLDQLDLPQVGVDAKEFKSLACATVSDCSNVGLGISTSSGFLSPDHKGIIPKFDVSSSIAFGTNPSYNIDSVGGSPEVISNGETCLSVDCSSKLIRKRKARGAQMGLSGTKANVCVGTDRSIDGETVRGLAEDLVPDVEVDFLGEKDSSKEDDGLNEGPSGGEDLILEADFGASSSSPGYQKRQKLSSPRSSLSSLSEDDTIADGLTTNLPILDQRPTREAEWGAAQREGTSSASTAINQCGTIYVEDINGDYASDSSDELLAPGFDMRSCMSSPEQLLAYSDLSFTGKTAASACLSENEMICGNDNISNKKSLASYPNIHSPRKSLAAAVKNLRANAHIPPSRLEDTSLAVKKLNPAYGKLTWSRNQQNSAVPKVIPGHHPSNFSNSRKLYPVHATKSRTWCRTGNSSVAIAEPKLQPSSVPKSHSTKVARTAQSSYVRKGNSLVRNPSTSGVTPPGFHSSSSSVYRLTPTNTMKSSQGSSGSVYRLTPTNTVKSNQESTCQTGDADAPTLTRIKHINTCEITKTPTLNHSGKSLSCTPCNLGESLPVGNPPRNSSSCKTLDAPEERVKTSPVLECRTDSVINTDSQSTFEEGKSEKKIIYVKRRSNQLVATSNSDDTAILGVDKNRSSLSDGYYKSRRNQLVRAPSKNLVKRGEANGKALRLLSHSIVPKTSTRRQSGFGKTSRYSKVSFVWKLHDTESSKKDKNSLGPQKVWPHLFSSKRAACWRSLILGTKSSNSSFSTISQKLLLSSRRGAIYTRSTHGYSLRMSKVLSVGGSSLKWSKSIERNSKKANEEATRAVAAAQKRKKEENGAAPIASKSRNHVSRERIFRIGSERYKMDTTRRTLHRITEKEPSSSVALQSEKNVKRSYIPRRLLIGNEEYVRIGNGNQLVRDPKKRTRVLASEKVRWSLRTARLRLARKKKYCQFFTRFGKCNKDDGKCPYIHDPSKIAVCTKFLNGSCSNLDCKLTHKVIPERMQDCSYFLKGSCSNENCPYRHVTVDPDSAVCESFLRGYCADGNECRKKHTYVCPAFEATGICPQASACKLHHPKKKTEKKPTSEQKIVRGRYFDGGLIGLADCIEASTEKLPVKEGKDDIVVEGTYPDYISLDVSDDEGDDAHIVELGIVHRDSVVDSSPVVEMSLSL